MCLVVLVCSLVLFCQLSAHSETEIAPVQDYIKKIREQVANGKICRLELVQVEPNINRISAMNPDQLERIPDYKLVIRNLDNKPYSQDLAMTLTNPELSLGEPGEISAGIIFYSRELGGKPLEDKRECAIYFDQTGYTTLIDGTYVRWKDNPLFLWYQANFGVYFKFKKSMLIND